MQKARRNEAILATRAFFNQPEDVVLLHTESAGTKTNPEVIEIAVLTFNGDLRFYSLIRPKHRLVRGASHSPPITNTMLAEAPTLPDVYPELCDAVRNKIVVAYNLSAATRQLDYAIALYRLSPLPSRQWVCAMRLYSAFIGSTTTAQSNRAKKLPYAERRAHSDGETMLTFLRNVANTPLSVAPPLLEDAYTFITLLSVPNPVTSVRMLATLPHINSGEG